MTMRKDPTMPASFWDEADDTAFDDDPMPMPVNPPKIREVPSLSGKPASSRTWTKNTSVETLASRAFTSNLNVSDVRVMAMALLQLQDQLREAMERIRRLEEQ